MSDPLFSQSSRSPNNSQRYDDDVVVVQSDVAHGRNCRGDCRWRWGFNPGGWGHRLRTAATEKRPQICWVVFFGRRYGVGFANDGDAVYRNISRGGTAGSRVSERDNERGTVFHV